MFQSMKTYRIKVQGALDEDVFNLCSPLRVAVTEADPEVTAFTFCTDQSGLTGMVRHLHRQGYLILSVERFNNEILVNEEEQDNEYSGND